MKSTLTEAAFQKMVLDFAKLHGWRRAHFRGVRVQRKDGSTYHQTPIQADGKGFPDILLLRGRECIVVELKTETRRLTPEQIAWITAFREAGIHAFIWKPSSWSEIERVIGDRP